MAGGIHCYKSGIKVNPYRHEERRLTRIKVNSGSHQALITLATES